ncbi:hypothetical protein COT98_04010 [Candidatus Falkowbacteria bacterium CG10_big_fil_rev_8_21_14_0_10_39_9]|uniref:YgjP-like metallopeptidase domain-containing protein n=1 Tax=Candidatus Falkowbacteria bacterium CG10_big_fil_rev_8_21_14_0_10_39_9 TaxID=1974566 RepID=A0A2M6WNP4_9BACT|nr:MAG: hypothetical protein COT98_04010 [Candidatus Falkowbacteria bacterium CG10_big_fil_rev_8_21_14_0_10_39_9]
MKKTITIAGQAIEYSIKRYKRNKNLRLTINNRGNLVASKPWYLSEARVERFIKSQATWVMEKLADFKLHNQNNPFHSSSQEYLKYKQSAERLVLKKIAKFNQHYQFQFARISVRNQKTRWGSCSSRGNLNFNYKIIFLAPRLIDYIIVHELCHLRELNHSIRFWNLVSQKIPQCQLIRQDLQKKGIELK